MRVCAVTGASGYAGGAICAELERSGWTVIRLGRRPGDVPLQLGESVSPDLFRSQAASALVHCAYDFSQVRAVDIAKVNVEGTRKLLGAARDAGVESIVVLSTLAAFPGCRSLYGQAKLQIEADATASGAWIIRPGLLWGDSLGGIVRKMDALIAKLPVVPLISGRRPFFCCHVDDLAVFVRKTLEASGPAPASAWKKPLIAARAEPLQFSDVLRRIARRRQRSPRFIPVPWQLAWGGLKALEALGLRVGLRSDSVVSLMHQNGQPDFAPGRRLGVEFRAVE